MIGILQCYRSIVLRRPLSAARRVGLTVRLLLAPLSFTAAAAE